MRTFGAYCAYGSTTTVRSSRFSCGEEGEFLYRISCSRSRCTDTNVAGWMTAVTVSTVIRIAVVPRARRTRCEEVFACTGVVNPSNRFTRTGSSSSFFRKALARGEGVDPLPIRAIQTNAAASETERLASPAVASSSAAHSINFVQERFNRVNARENGKISG